MQLTHEEYRDAYIKILKIIEETKNRCKKPKNAIEFFKDSAFDPLVTTQQGMFLEIHCDKQWSVISPFGKWRFVRDSSILGTGTEDLIKELENQKIIELHSKQPRTLRAGFNNTFQKGPEVIIPNQETRWYAILKVIDKELPKAHFK